MTISYFFKKICKIFIFAALLSLFPDFLFSQIRIFERPTNKELKNTGIFFESATRSKIDLNGEWEISFNEGKSFEKYIVPLAYDFKGQAIFRKKIEIPEELLSSSSFIFVAEGIDYESEIKINNNFIANHTGGYTPIISTLSDGIILKTNEILITVGNELNFKNTSPLSDQINYSRVYGGITKDIYLMSVPKLYSFYGNIKYTIDNLLTCKIRNTIDIKSTSFFNTADTLASREFFVHTEFIRRSTNIVAGQSEKMPFTIGDNKSIKMINDVTIPDLYFWTPETPEIYIARIVITNAENEIIDEFIIETGFTNYAKKGNEFYANGKAIRINGINYYEDQPKFASALEYSEVEKDLKNIKTLGFNCIRVPGRCANPYIVNVCNRLGLFLFQEIPFNELSDYYLDKENYIRQNLNYLSEIIERDRNSPSIFAWGIGNDFDVSKTSSLDYVKSAVSIIDSLNKRFTYYTSRAYNSDICSEEVDMVGINFYESSFEKVKNTVTEITNKSKPVNNRKNNSLFVSCYGLNIENSNSNGFSDLNSQEAQMKFLSECFLKFSTVIPGNFISSYADWNSENPLNYPLDKNPYLKTNGIYTFGREQKRSADIVKRLLNNEDMPRIQEGNFVSDFPYIFIITGIIVIVILTYFINRDKKFRSSLIRCLYKPTYFYSLVKDQMIISTGYNLLLAFTISIGLALYFSSILFYFRENNSFDMILAKIFSNDSVKIFYSNIVNNKFYLISFLTGLNLIMTFLTAFFLYFISFYTKGKSFFKNIYTICVWSTLPMLIFLFVGTVLYKLTETNPAMIKISMWAFLILYILYLNRIILGTKSLFDIRTGKVYLYGIIIILFIFAIIYSYFLFFTGAIETINLVSNLNT